jgi:hypothetical protein
MRDTMYNYFKGLIIYLVSNFILNFNL